MSGRYLQSRLLVLNVLENGHAATTGGMERRNASLSGMAARSPSCGAGRGLVSGEAVGHVGQEGKEGAEGVPSLAHASARQAR